jgi:hypothetical protein
MTSLVSRTDQLENARSTRRNIEYVAMLSENDFMAARASIADFSDYADYEDWLDDRYGITVGLGSSGVDARMALVEISHFLAWCRYAKLAPSAKNLEDFASMVAIVRDDLRIGQDLNVVATFSPAEFVAYADLIEAFQSVADYSGWVAHREAREQAALASGAIVCRAPAPIPEFLAWARCLGVGSSEAMLDRFASLALEAFICP